MLVVVNQPHINDFKIEGTISPSFLDYLKKEYGDAVQVQDDDNDLVKVTETDWYKGIKAVMTPPVNLAFYRKERGFTQTKLADLVGVKKQYISDMEHGRKSISKNMAKKLAAALDCPVSDFI